MLFQFRTRDRKGSLHVVVRILCLKKAIQSIPSSRLERDENLFHQLSHARLILSMALGHSREFLEEEKQRERFSAVGLRETGELSNRLVQWRRRTDRKKTLRKKLFQEEIIRSMALLDW